MDLGFLSSLFGDKTKDGGMLSALVPLLLSSKSRMGDRGGLGDILSTLFKGNARDTGDGYPPLFGEVQKSGSGAQNNVLDILGGVLNQSDGNKQKQVEKIEYPYELQYNRPIQSK